MGNLYIALLHYPVYDRSGKVITAALTNMDVHDIARAARTYGVKRFFVVTPVEAMRWLAERIIDHWRFGYGSSYNARRQDALSLVVTAADLDSTIIDIEREEGTRPFLVVTSARAGEHRISYPKMRMLLESEARSFLMLFGTGWGLTEETLAAADFVLEPIVGVGEYNHLSVRSAAAIILDRLCDPRASLVKEKGHGHS